MNFLGHFYLSQNDPDLIVGNYIADFVKGKKYSEYPPAIAQGIIMHREIDYYTDRHPMVRKGRKRLFKIYRHYSGVIMDMYYDHFLANLWHEYSTSPLINFADYIYNIIEQNWVYLPENSQFMFPYMKSGNWLLRYATTDGIGKSLNGMSRRLNNNSQLERAVNQLHEFYEDFQVEFRTFIIDINNHIKDKKF